MIRNVLYWQIRTVIFRHLINFFDISSPSTGTIITQSVKIFISFFVSIYLEVYCAVFPFNNILICDFIRQTKIGLLGYIFRIEKKGRKKKRNMKTKLVRGPSNRKVFPLLLVRKLALPWRRGQLCSSAFGGRIEKEETAKKGTRLVKRH